MEGKLAEKLYYSIGEVADAFHVNTSLIRFWEKEFDTLKPKKNNHGKRKYSQDDIKLIKTIYHLVKERGFTLEGARDYLRNKKSDLSTSEVVEKLEFVKRELLKIKAEL
jgi:DNA-binding transcriptional MerR regulator